MVLEHDARPTDPLPNPKLVRNLPHTDVSNALVGRSSGDGELAGP
jgi:hypothetical protein